MTIVGSACTSGPDRSMAIMASALLMMISSRVSSSSARRSASSYICSASSISPARTLANAARRRSSEPVNNGSGIPALALSAIWLKRVVDLLRALELDEALHLFLGGGTERFQFVEH